MTAAPTRRFLVTAGSTREMIDDVRGWGNIFTGNTGFAIARALAVHGPVDLLTSNKVHRAQLAGGQTTPHPVRATGFVSHADLKAALAAALKRSAYDAVFMTAAIADYRPAGAFQVLERRGDPAGGRETWTVASVQAGKVKSSYPQIAILGRPTEKLVDLFRGEWGFRGLLFKFKLEVGLDEAALLKVGRASREASGADYLVANTLAMVQGERAGAYVIGASGEEFVRRADLAGRLAELAVGLAQGCPM